MSDQNQIPPYMASNFYMPPRKKSWRTPIIIISVIAAIIIFVAFALLSTFMNAVSKSPTEVVKNSVLHLNFTALKENSLVGFLNFRENDPTFWEILKSIKAAKTDDNIKGIYITTGGAQMGYAKASEIQDALKDFKSSGKFIYAYLDFASKMDYFLALPADSIFMPMEGITQINGFGISQMFFKNALDKIGVEYVVQQFEEYKSYAETYQRNGMSPASRESYKVLLDQRYEIFTKAVSEYRKIDLEKVKEAINKGVFTPSDAKEYGLIDAFVNENEVKEKLKSAVFTEFNKQMDKLEKKSLPMIKVSDYLASENFPHEKYKTSDQIAIIFASGTISPNASSEGSITSKGFIRSLKLARDDDKIKVIIIRIDSPGGSVLTSDEIYQEILKTKAKKPVYASMSDVAASGGYFMAMPCDTIIAHPATITGSIGVIFALPNFSKTLEKLSISVDTLSTNKSAYFLDVTLPVTQAQKDQLYFLSKPVYERFVNKVATHRKMDYESARAVAKGRVWTGADAKERNLVDVLGGLKDAIEVAKKRIGIPKEDNVRIKTFPRKLDAITSIIKLLFGDEDEQLEMKATLFNQNPIQKLPFAELLPKTVINQTNYFYQLADITKKEQTMMALPYLPE